MGRATSPVPHANHDDDAMETIMTKPQYVGLGVALGAAIGAAIGSALHMGAWVPIGIGIGLAIGSSLSGRSAVRKEEPSLRAKS